MRKIFLTIVLMVISVRANAKDIPKSIRLTPKVIRETSKDNGLTILEAAIRVHKAKENVYLARTRLLPSVNLGMLISAFVNPTFVLSNVEYLVPFLLPSRWFDLWQAKNLSQSERMAFLTTELNIFASLESLYYTILSDQVARDLLAADLRDALVFENSIERSVEDGRASEVDLSLARSQSSMAFTRLAKMDELLIEEISEMRKVLSLDISTEIFFDWVPAPVSVLENTSVPEAAEAILKVAPEALQLDYLVKAAESEKWSKIFSFISSGSIGSSGGGASSGIEHASAFKNLNGRGMLHFSFDYFPNISMSNHNINELNTRKKELGVEFAALTENILGKLQFLFARQAEILRSEALLQSVFKANKLKYEAGELSLSDLLNSQSNVRQAKLENVRATTDLNLMRVTLHRMLLTDEFALVKGCEELPRTPNTGGGWRWPWEDAPEENICDPEAVEKRFSGTNPDPLF